MRDVVNSKRVSARICELNSGFYLQIKNPMKLFEKKNPARRYSCRHTITFFCDFVKVQKFLNNWI